MQQGFVVISPGKFWMCVLLLVCYSERTLSVTAVRIIAWVMRESPYISRSAFERFFTETPNTSSWLNLHTQTYTQNKHQCFDNFPTILKYSSNFFLAGSGEEV